MTTLSRMVQDLYIWNSDEFRSVDFRFGGEPSSIMPQKKNGYSRDSWATSGQVVGALIDALFVHKGVVCSLQGHKHIFGQALLARI